MPSTYSPILGIELIASGEQANTWGFTTNNNLGTLIEQSIAGQADVVMTTSSHTLTDLDGVSDEARCMILNVSGVLASTGTVICPNNTKVYVIANNTSGGYDIELRTSGGAGVLVPAGTAKTVFCDGVDVFESVTAIDTLLLGGDPTDDLQAVPRQYVDNNFLSLGGGTLTGALTLPGVPTTSLQAATKSYADQKIPLAGGTMTGPLYLSVSPVDGDPALQAATKYYVDNAVSGGVGGYVPTSRTLTAGTGLTGGGDLTANRTFALATSGVAQGSYANPTIVVDEYGRITSATPGGASGVTSVTAVSPLSSSGGTTPQISLSGTVSISNGGTGSSTSSGALASLGAVPVNGALGTPSSGNLASCTGYLGSNISGAVATASALASGANLGTPSSGTLSSCTGYNASNLTGTVAITAGGTGATSASAALTNLGGVSTSGSYANPSWISSLAGSKISGSLSVTAVTTTTLTAGSGSIYTGTAGNLQIVCGTRPTNISGVSDGYSCIFFQNSLSVVASISPTGTYIGGVSDAKFKDNITPIAYGLAEINKLQPKTYDVTFETEARAARGLPPKIELGLVAQEVEPIIPEIVSPPNESVDHYLLNYTGLIPVLVKAIQELSAEVEALKAKVG